MQFSIGIVSVAGALLGWLAVYGNFGLRRLSAWYHKTEPPKDRVHVGAFVTALVLFVLGSFIQPQYSSLSECRSAGNKLGECIFNINKSS